MPGAFRSLGRIDDKELLHLYGVGERLVESAVYVRSRPSRQWLTVTTAVLGQVTVQLGYHGRSQGLQPHASGWCAMKSGCAAGKAARSAGPHPRTGAP